MTRNFKHIAECTQLNEHSEAIMLGAIYFGLDGVKSKIAKLIAEHIHLGYLDHEMVLRQREIRQELLAYTKRVLNDADYQNFYMSF